MRKQNLTFGLIVGTRGFFSSHLAGDGRAQLIAQLDKLGHKHVILPAAETATGAVETTRDGLKCATLFNQHRSEIDGIIVSLPNFGDELGIITTIQTASLGVPVLVQASDDDLDKLGPKERRDSFCGKLSVCNNLYQCGIPFTDTGTHTVALSSAAFTRDLEHFAAVCRVTGSLKRARIGAIGARPAAFQTMRASEKLMQASGITVVPVDLSEIMAWANRVDIQSERAKQKLAEMNAYGTMAPGINNLDEKMWRHVRLYIAVEDWMNDNMIDAAGFQCWTSIQQNYGCATCLTMSMMSEKLIPSACEVDIAGVTAMYALVQATGEPAALIDWNNNYGDDRNKCVAQHCSNFPRSFVGKPVEIGVLSVLGANLGEEICFGGIQGKAAAGPMTYCRISTDDRRGRIKAYVGDAEFTDDPFNMAGGIAVCQVPNLQKLMKYITKNGFEHHSAMVRKHCSAVIDEAFTNYLGWDVYRHE